MPVLEPTNQLSLYDSGKLQRPPTIEEYQKILNEYKDILHKAKTKKTPKDRIVPKSKDFGYDYAEFSYMEEVADDIMPLRSIEYKVINPEVFTTLGWVTVECTVTNLITNERRVGIDAHRITFSGGKEALIAALHAGTPTWLLITDIGNDIKSAMKESLRKAYSEFGICADLYKKVKPKPPSPEQSLRFNTAMSALQKAISDMPTDKAEKWKSWADTQKKSFNKQTIDSADVFIDSVIKYIPKQSQVTT